MRILCLFSILALGFSFPALSDAEPRPALTDPFDAYGMSAPIPPEALAHVMVLGTPHIAVLGDSLTRAHLEPVISRLENFSPEVIAVEQLPGETIQAMLARKETYGPIIEHFAAWIAEHGVEAQKRLQRDADGARAELNDLLATFANAKQVDESARRKAAAFAIAAFDLPTAALQWRYLPVEFRKAGDGVVEADAERLNKLLGGWNETYAIGVEAAWRLGHQRMASIDDHLDKDQLLPIMDALDAQLKDSDVVAEVMKSPVYAEMAERQQKAVEAGSLWPLYEWMNSAAFVQQDVAGQFHLFFRVEDDKGIARKRSALWEVRNLNIASNIRRASADVGAGNVVVLIGAGHKAFLEAYLAQMMDVTLVQAAELPGSI